MNDNDIIKALGCCAVSNCDDCPYFKFGNCLEKLQLDAVDLINRLKAENERLKDMVAQNEGVLPKYENLIKSEAIKEFAERLKESLEGKTDPVDEYDIDVLVKKMTEGRNEHH